MGANAYLSGMLRGTVIALILTLAAPAWAIDPADDSGTISIMRPEPGTKPAKHKRKPAHEEAPPPKGFGVKQDSRRGSSNPVYPAPLPKPQAPAAGPRIDQPARRAAVPPSMYVPETGRTLPNLPSGPGPETTQDKSVRCAHQAGAYGPSATGNPTAYIGSCINQ